MQTAGLFLQAETAYRREQLQKTYRPVRRTTRVGWRRRVAGALARVPRRVTPAGRPVPAPHH